MPPKRPTHYHCGGCEQLLDASHFTEAQKVGRYDQRRRCIACLAMMRTLLETGQLPAEQQQQKQQEQQQAAAQPEQQQQQQRLPPFLASIGLLEEHLIAAGPWLPIAQLLLAEPALDTLLLKPSEIPASVLAKSSNTIDNLFKLLKLLEQQLSKTEPKSSKNNNKDSSSSSSKNVTANTLDALLRLLTTLVNGVMDSLDEKVPRWRATTTAAAVQQQQHSRANLLSTLRRICVSSQVMNAVASSNDGASALVAWLLVMRNIVLRTQDTFERQDDFVAAVVLSCSDASKDDDVRTVPALSLLQALSQLTFMTCMKRFTRRSQLRLVELLCRLGCRYAARVARFNPADADLDLAEVSTAVSSILCLAPTEETPSPCLGAVFDFLLHSVRVCPSALVVDPLLQFTYTFYSDGRDSRFLVEDETFKTCFMCSTTAMQLLRSVELLQSFGECFVAVAACASSCRHVAALASLFAPLLFQAPDILQVQGTPISATLVKAAKAAFATMCNHEAFTAATLLAASRFVREIRQEQIKRNITNREISFTCESICSSIHVMIVARGEAANEASFATEVLSLLPKLIQFVGISPMRPVQSTANILASLHRLLFKRSDSSVRPVLFQKMYDDGSLRAILVASSRFLVSAGKTANIFKFRLVDDQLNKTPEMITSFWVLIYCAVVKSALRIEQFALSSELADALTALLDSLSTVDQGIAFSYDDFGSVFTATLSLSQIAGSVFMNKAMVAAFVKRAIALLQSIRNNDSNLSSIPYDPRPFLGVLIGNLQSAASQFKSLLASCSEFSNLLDDMQNMKCDVTEVRRMIFG